MERLLISTYNGIVLWDGKPRTIWDKRGHEKYRNFYGITWNRDRIYVAEGGHAGHSLYHVFDYELNWEGTLTIGSGIADPHQIYWWRGGLFIVSAKQDKIFLHVGTALHEVRGWKKKGEPTLHLNSIWSDGNLFYVVEHRKREMPKRIRMLDPTLKPVGCIELTREAFIKDRPHGIHNVYIEDDVLYTCSPKAFVRHDFSSGKSEPIVPCSLMNDAHYVRGLARTKGKFFVGLSETKVRDKRGEGDSAVLVLDDDFKVLDTLVLKNTGGLNDIRAVDGPDLAHNGVECPYG